MTDDPQGARPWDVEIRNIGLTSRVGSKFKSDVSRFWQYAAVLRGRSRGQFDKNGLVKLVMFVPWSGFEIWGLWNLGGPAEVFFFSSSARANLRANDLLTTFIILSPMIRESHVLRYKLPVPRTSVSSSSSGNTSLNATFDSLSATEIWKWSLDISMTEYQDLTTFRGMFRTPWPY
jgi:hypothetical protein